MQWAALQCQFCSSAGLKSVRRLLAWSFAKTVCSSWGDDRGKKQHQKCSVFSKDCPWLWIYWLIYFFFSLMSLLYLPAGTRNARYKQLLCANLKMLIARFLGGYRNPQISNCHPTDTWKTFVNCLSYCHWYRLNNINREYIVYLYLSLLLLFVFEGLYFPICFYWSGHRSPRQVSESIVLSQMCMCVCMLCFFFLPKRQLHHNIQGWIVSEKY